MKKELNPIVLVCIVVVAVVGLAVWGYRAMQPSDYMPSPGVGGRPPHNPDYMKQGVQGGALHTQGQQSAQPGTGGGR